MKSLATIATTLLVVFFTKAQNVTIPDPNFKTALLNHSPKIDTNNDGEIQIIEAENFTGRLDLHQKEITDLTGLSAFKNIKELLSQYNYNTSINLSKLTKLEKLMLFHNTKLTSVNMTNNSLLKEVKIEHNKELTLVKFPNSSNNLQKINLSACNLNEVDVSKCTNLKTIIASYNKNLTVLKLPTATTFKSLDVRNTALTNINVSAFLDLGFISCAETKVKELNLSKNTALTQVFASDNPNLESVNIKNGQNTKLTDLDLESCPKLTHICVDDVAYANAQNTSSWIKDASATYVEDCSLSTNNTFNFTNTVAVYPNPTNSLLHLKTSRNFAVKNVKVYSVLGKKVLETSSFPISLKKLNKGIYLLKINNTITKKIIKY